MGPEPQPPELIENAIAQLSAQMARQQPDWTQVILLAQGITRLAGNELHDPEAYVAVDLDHELAAYDRELDECISEALDTALERFEQAGAVVLRLALVVDGYDAGTASFRVVLGTPGGDLSELVALLGSGYERLNAITPAPRSHN